METHTDPITLALTGVLHFGVLAGALLAYPVGRLLLALYRRSVARSMAAAGGAQAEASAAPDAFANRPGTLRIADWKVYRNGSRNS